jgi:S1-C subfamily serine protease
MRSILTGLLLLLAAPAFGADIGSAVPTGDNAVARTVAPSDSECKVTHYAGGRIGSGSGTVVASGKGVSRVLTNHHVCPDDGDRITVEHKGKAYPAARLAWDKSIDLACLEVRGVELPAAKIAAGDPAPGSTVRQWGHPKACKEAVPKSGRAIGGRTIFATTIPSESGDSGAGVFDAAGDLVGVCWGRRLDNGTETCVPLADVRRFLRMDPPAAPAITSPRGSNSADCPPGQP